MEVASYCVFLVPLLSAVGAQLVFQENNIDPSIKNRDNRQPIYAPSKCSKNELLYPGDQKNDWICDCRPAYLFHPGTDLCHAAYRRGPCAEREYLILPPGSAIPECVTNPCHQDGYVRWNSKCVLLASSEHCPTEAGRVLRLGVNASTLLIECQPITFGNRLGESEEISGAPCAKGSRTSVCGKCNSTGSTQN